MFELFLADLLCVASRQSWCRSFTYSSLLVTFQFIIIILLSMSFSLVAPNETRSNGRVMIYLLRSWLTGSGTVNCFM